MKRVQPLRTRRQASRGFTFLEMALTLFSLGFLLAAVPRLASQSTEVLQASPVGPPLDAATLAINGFALTYNRLPCPASHTAAPTAANFGVEDCSLQRGTVPHRTLRLARPVTNGDDHPMVYSVYRNAAENADLAVASARFTPTYENTLYDSAVENDQHLRYKVTPPTSTSAQVNGLDLCAKLRGAAALPANAALTGTYQYLSTYAPTDGVNVAWVLAEPGNRNADNSSGAPSSIYDLFDGRNRVTGAEWFESPGKAQVLNYDDRVRAAGFSQLFSELKCPQLLASVSAAAREADFANDNLRMRKFLLEFRLFEKDSRKQKQTQAENMRLVAIFDTALSAALSALDLGVALAGASGAAAIAVNAINAITAIGLSAYNLSEAIKTKQEADQEFTEAGNRVNEARQEVTRAVDYRTSIQNALTLLDRRSWFQ